ncbi:hypothetical protein QIS99_25965 [Streptomyces sp. B-S-A8]|uniref:Uncharacterized protein n=1 Tax=Streptomyces solicavernae TaxID=3043614 RepID=A0ABT6RYU5_9ACTN|nr:hypothetical protein [Streptomyces sp. B-S-A8]MDI3389607.1 hypothetical protein [Streptomyces sp. B-S-A8]
MAQRPDLMTRIIDALNNKALSALIGIVSLAAPVAAWVVGHVNLVLLVVGQEALILFFVVTRLWSDRTHIRLRRTNSIEAMDNPPFYDRIRSQVERSLTTEYRRIADGYLTVNGPAVPLTSVMLVDALIATETQPQRILAVDRTTDPHVLTGRREYLDANRRFIDSGGRIDRLFVVRRQDLVDEDFVRPLLKLIDHHQELGVICGLAVREHLRQQDTVDTVVFGDAAVLIEDEQGDAAYTQGRSTVFFKGIEGYSEGCTRAWEHGLGATTALRTYRDAVRPLMDAWDPQQAADVVESL